MTAAPKSPVNQLSIEQSRALLSATKREGVSMTAEARERVESHAASLEGVPHPKATRARVSALRKVAPPHSIRSAMSPTNIACRPSSDEAKLNRQEREYLALLRAAHPSGWVGAQCLTFKLGDDCRYTPDFIVLDAAGVLWAHEVKGFMRDDALVKLKAGARKFSWVRFVLAKKQGGVWETKEIAP